MLNRILLQGRLVADPEHKQTPNGVSVTTFRIACDRNFADKSGNRQADFIPIVAWRATADFVARFFTKGKMILLEGTLQSRNYTDKDGNKRTAFEVIADQVYFGDSKGGDSRPAAAAPSNFPTPENFQEPTKGQGFSIGDFEEIDADDNELPF